MKTFLRSCIIIISLAIIMILGADYHRRLASYLCQNRSFCNSSLQVSDNPQSPQIIYTTGTKIYDEIRFYQDNSEDMSRFEELKSQGYTCGLGDHGGGYGIGGGALGCEKVPGYYHQYDITEWGIRFIAYDNVMPIYHEGPFGKTEIDMPFYLSGNTLYENGGIEGSTFTIEYHPNRKENEVPLSILQSQPQIVAFQGEEYMRQDHEAVSNGIVYQSQDPKSLLPFFYFGMHFKLVKDYYYTTRIYGFDCIPGPCGIGQHTIEYFHR